MSLLDLLVAEDVEGFNSNRTERARPDLFAVELAGKTLISVDLTGANLDKADLTGSDLSDATLVRASMTDIDGTGMNLTGVVGFKVRFRGAYMDGSDLSEGDFTKGDFTEVNLEGATAVGARFTTAKMREVNGTKANFTDADFSEAGLHEANFTSADLSRCDLSASRGNKICFNQARLDSVVAREARWNEGSVVGASMVGARLDSAELEGVDLSGADLTACDLSRANLSGANLKGAILRGACLAEASLEGADLTDADLTDADLTGLDPKAFGLDAAQVEQLSRWGVQVDDDAPMRPMGVEAAGLGEDWVVTWTNLDGEDERSMRWAVVGSGGNIRRGVVQVPGSLVVASSMGRGPEGPVLAIVQERAGSMVLVVMPLSSDGPGKPRTLPLGYTPTSRPIVGFVDGVLHLWGLGKRGPSVIVQRLTDEGLEPVLVERQPTAVGFAGRHHPILRSKGGVLMPIGPRRIGRPVRTPSDFEGEQAVAVPEGEFVRVFWFGSVAPGEGFIETSLLGGRGRPSCDRLVSDAEISSIDAFASSDATHVAWVDHSTGIGLVRLLGPEGFVDLDCLQGALAVRFVDGGAGEPAVLGLLADGTLGLCATDGRTIGTIG